jgi:hypothetical protein
MILKERVVGRPARGAPAGWKPASSYVLAAATVGVATPDEDPPQAVRETTATPIVRSASARGRTRERRTSESFLEPVTHMGWHEAPELEHDLCVLPQRDRTNVPGPEPAVDPGAHALAVDGSKAGQSTWVERLPPDREELPKSDP